MCTLSFIPKDDGFLIGMNRDESLTRGSAEPPAIHETNGMRTVFPTDVEGGTWIAVTERGDCFALLNRNGGDRRRKQRSRGEIIKQAAGCKSANDVQVFLTATDLARYLPFRLIGVYASERKLCEWAWNGEQLFTTAYDWQPRHWFSSGLSDQEATVTRSRVFENAWQMEGAGTAEWLRRIHGSHNPQPGAFSVCVHRDDAASLSYTEIYVCGDGISMSYYAGSPCQSAAPIQVDIPRFKPVAAL